MTEDLKEAIKALDLEGECLLIKAGSGLEEYAHQIGEMLEKKVLVVADFDDIKLLVKETVVLPN